MTTQAESNPCANEIAQLSQDAIIFTHRKITCYAINHIEQYPNLYQTIQRKSAEAFKNQGYQDAADTPKQVNPYSYRIIVWDHDTARIISSYKLSLVNKTISHYGWDYLSISYLFNDLDNLLTYHDQLVLLESSFVAVDYQRKGLALLFAMRGTYALISQLAGDCTLIGMTSLPYPNYDKLVLNLYISCLRHSKFYHKAPYHIEPCFPCDETAYLAEYAPELLTASQQPRDLNAIEQFIQTSTQTDFKLPVLIRNYIEHFDSEIIEFGYDHQVKSVDALQLTKFKKDADYKIVK